MSAAAEPSVASQPPSKTAPLVRFATDPLWRNPLVPVALFATAGIVLDRALGLPFAPSIFAMAATLLGWFVCARTGTSGKAVFLLWTAAAALGAGCHHHHLDSNAADDVRLFTDDDGHPVVLRGTIVTEPFIYYRDPQSALRSLQRPDPLEITLAVTSIRRGPDWLPCSGKVRLIASAYPVSERYVDLPPDLHVGDVLEVAGVLSTPRGPGNPGEIDSAAVWRDQQVSAILHVRKDPDALVRLDRGWTGTPLGWLGALHGWCQRQLKDSIRDEKEAGLAMALFLGKGAELTPSDWNKFSRNGVIHVLVISGQHMVVLAYLLWKLPRMLGVRRRYAALIVVAVLMVYSLFVGAGPPVLRASVTVSILCFGYFLCRPTTPANSLAAAWLAIVAVNPTQVFNHGCQLSFLSVAVLTWGASRWFESPPIHPQADSPIPVSGMGFRGRLSWLFGIRYLPDELQHVIDEGRPAWQKIGLAVIRAIARVYLVTATVWIAAAPLVAANYHSLAPIAILILPPLALLASIALVAGFFLLLSSALLPFLVPTLAWITGGCMGLCERLVDLAALLPGSRWTTAPVPEWWLWGFYVPLLALLLLESLRPYWRWFLLAGLGWICLLLALPAARWPSDEMHCTFLAVGHGGCTVIETPDGRVLLYDVGAVIGPEMAQRQVVPYLLHRGIRKIDEVFLSHADLDHFNGLLLLADEIPIGQVTRTPTFADKDTAGVRHTVSTLERRGIPVRIVHAGQTFTAGNVEIEVLHPPEQVPESPDENENSRSLVLLVRHEGHSILLTGDLAGPGLTRFLKADFEPVDILMAPHHGSKQSNTPALDRQLRPQVVISNQGPPPEGAVLRTAYPNAHCLDTWTHGAIDIRSHHTGLIVETFRTKERLVIRKR
jgi:competence protein ComEC